MEEEKVISDTAIDDAISLIDEKNNEVSAVKNEIKEVSKQQAKEISIDDLTNKVLESVMDVNKKTDEVYDMFFTPISIGKDRSDVSKQSLMDSIRLKNESMQNIASVINAKAKLIAAQNQQSAKVGIMVQSKSGEDVGINLENLS
jgi:hypothetical protein